MQTFPRTADLKSYNTAPSQKSLLVIGGKVMVHDSGKAGSNRVVITPLMILSGGYAYLFLSQPFG